MKASRLMTLTSTSISGGGELDGDEQYLSQIPLLAVSSYFLCSIGCLEPADHPFLDPNKPSIYRSPSVHHKCRRATNLLSWPSTCPTLSRLQTAEGSLIPYSSLRIRPWKGESASGIGSSSGHSLVPTIALMVADPSSCSLVSGSRRRRSRARRFGMWIRVALEGRYSKSRGSM